MEFRKSLETDINDIMRIIKQAQKYFKENSVDQWQNNYPNDEIIREDIKNKASYVFIENNKIIATVAVSFDGEDTYNKIYEGEWINTKDNYGVIHRIAVDNEYKGNGVAGKVINSVEELCIENGIYNIKADTHEDNTIMKNFLKKNHFKYCGVIYLQDNSRRLAFEKEIRVECEKNYKGKISK